MHQHTRGPHATHTGFKRALQSILMRGSVTGSIQNEKRSTFTLSAGEQRMGMTLDPDALIHCGTPAWEKVGFLLDDTIRSPRTRTLVAQAALAGGHAASVGERDKIRHYSDWIRVSQLELVPVAQETYGRMGKTAVTFLKHLASHAANCKRGTEQQVQLRRASVYAGIRTDMSVRLAAELAERLCAYAGSAKKPGRTQYRVCCKCPLR
jgi:hypothetical protein